MNIRALKKEMKKIRHLKKEMKKIKNGYYTCKLELSVTDFSGKENNCQIITIHSIDYDTFESALIEYICDNGYKGFYSRIIRVIDLKVLEWQKKRIF